MEDRLLNIIEILEDAIDTDDWKLVTEAKKELNFIYEEFESPFGMDDFDDEY